MRHGKKFNHLGRTAPHRAAMLSNMAASLILHKRINTTVAKAKALRKYVEPLITKAKNDTTHSRRMVFSYLQDKGSVTELFNVVADKVGNRPGGYTRILKTGARLGDNAEMCIMELVDFNELMQTETTAKKSRRSRRGGSKSKSETTPQVESKDEAVEEAEVVETTAEAEVAEVEEAAKEEETKEVEEVAEVEEAKEETKEVEDVAEVEEAVKVEETKEEAEPKAEEAPIAEEKETEAKEEVEKPEAKKEEESEDKKASGDDTQEDEEKK
eukprot:gnl/MRDRNA2_/MRDRNA2_180719_c0_seq1.p1 gnl/MRDRNA2_/MRDRNA2_180719_c0~~gnl/MRDRNA2_/MRDRNA2_180719_c0_seq1.p1  ORF type:complete len:270 (+),score=86.95 gnl/MRDRNA2_/MRDRNA2_180719_c0_seq1:77-886(+)